MGNKTANEGKEEKAMTTIALALKGSSLGTFDSIRAGEKTVGKSMGSVPIPNSGTC